MSKAEPNIRWLVAPCLIGALYGLHRLALWMETKGWIFYTHKKASPNALGNAVLGVQQLLQPGVEHVSEMRQSPRVQQDDAGGPDKAGGTDSKQTGDVGSTEFASVPPLG